MTNSQNVCGWCGKPRLVMIFRNNSYCSDNCRKKMEANTSLEVGFIEWAKLDNETPLTADEWAKANYAIRTKEFLK